MARKKKQRPKRATPAKSSQPPPRAPKMEPTPAAVEAAGFRPGTVIDLPSEEQWQTFAAAHRLTARQLDVLKLTCQGLKRKAIARKLNLGLGTVNTHADHLHKKFDLHDRMLFLAQVTAFIKPRR